MNDTIEWTAKSISDLPDSSFAYIEPGGTKDAVGKTVPRSLRHLPFKTENGQVEPFLLEKALENVEKSALSASVQKRVKAKLVEYAKGALEETTKAEDVMPCPCGDGACAGVPSLKSMSVEKTEEVLGVAKYITGSGNKWHVHAESGKVLGTHGSKADAVAQLRAIEWHKAHPTAKDEGLKTGSVEKDESTTWPRGPESADKPRPGQKEKDVHWPVDDSRFRGSSLTDAGQKAPNQKTKKMIDVLKEQEPGSRVVALYFDKTLYPTAQDVLKWVNDHGFTKSKVATSKSGFRVMQTQDEIQSPREIQLTEGVSATIGFAAKSVEAVREAFFLTATGRLAFKSDQLVDAECEPVRETSDGTIWRVKVAGLTFHFAEQGGVAAHLPFYGLIETMKQATFFIPVEKAVGGAEQRYTLSVVYPASKKGSPEPDFHGDVMSEEELEKSAWGFMNKGTDRIGLMHRPGTSGAGKVVESYIWRGPEWKMKDAGGKEQAVSPGDWVMGIVWEPAAWQAIKSGQITGLSLQGAARKEAF